jgi:hypothetical protein
MTARPAAVVAGLRHSTLTIMAALATTKIAGAHG